MPQLFFFIILIVIGIILRLILGENTFSITSKKTFAHQDQYLIEHFYYYTKLSQPERKIFLKRVNRFIENKRFIGRQSFEITGDVKLMVAASAIQISFGLRKYMFPSFRTIFIYPDIYINRFTLRYHRGEVNPHGLIAMSWKHFLRGYEDYTDKINLGLHEMAHALFITIMKRDYIDSDYLKYLRDVVKLSEQELLNYTEDFKSFFRDYASNNVQEFFAVAVESFFEAPNEFKKTLPILYNHLSRLLNQDPSENKYRSLLPGLK